LPLELTNRNDGQGRSWHRTAGDRQSIEKLLIFERLTRIPFDHSVTLCLTRILGKGQRFWDADSGLRGNSKQLIDSLVAVGWFHDDSVKWIEEVRFFQDASQKKNGPAVLIEVFQVNGVAVPEREIEVVEGF
jgi:hypothetical protein